MPDRSIHPHPKDLAQKPIVKRLLEIKDIPSPLTWQEIWSVYSFAAPDGVWRTMLRGIAWQARLGTWMAGFGANACQSCGKNIRGRTHQLYCGPTCSSAGRRRNKQDRFLDANSVAAEGRVMLASVKLTVEDARAMNARETREDLPRLMPPDWSEIADLPPYECDHGCTQRRCVVTGSRHCCFVNTPSPEKTS